MLKIRSRSVQYMLLRQSFLGAQWTLRKNHLYSEVNTAKVFSVSQAHDFWGVKSSHFSSRGKQLTWPDHKPAGHKRNKGHTRSTSSAPFMHSSQGRSYSYRLVSRRQPLLCFSVRKTCSSFVVFGLSRILGILAWNLASSYLWLSLWHGQIVAIAMEQQEPKQF